MQDSTTNVVHIDSYDRRRGLSQAESIGLLHTCRDMARDRLSSALGAMMDKVDDALFDMVDKAENSTVQTAIFDAMRDVRLKRPAIEAEFERRLMDAANDEIARSHSGRTGSGLTTSPEAGLTLVEDDELEESLAVSNMVTKLGVSCKDELFALDNRVGFLLNDPELTNAGNPISAEIICNSFKSACDQLDTRIEVKLIIHKLFDKCVVSGMKETYQEINQYLADKDILPNLPGPKIARRATASVHSNTGTDISTGGSESAGQDLFTTLQQLMSLNPAPAVTAQDAYQVNPNAQANANVDVLKALTCLQQGQTRVTLNGGTTFDFPELDASALTTGTSNILRDLKATITANNLPQADLMTIDIVAMMFDYILDDKNIPDFIKALIGRLQIPVLKVAMMDKEIFSKKMHPARRMLDMLAHAAIGCGDEQNQNDELCQKIEGIVRKIINEFENNINIFGELLAELEQCLIDEEKRVEEHAERSAKAVQRKERREVAETIIQDEIQRRLDSETIPHFLTEFLSVHWKVLLIVTYVKDDAVDQSWNGALHTMDDLIRSVAFVETTEDAKKLVRMLPDLLRRLKKGMELIAMPNRDRTQFLESLAVHHAKIVSVDSRVCDNLKRRTRDAGPLASNPGTEMRGPLKSPDTHTGAVKESRHVDVFEPRDDKPTDVPAYTRETIKQLLGDDEVQIDRVNAVNKSTTNHGNDDEHQRTAADLKKGTWVEFNHHDGTTTRAKLTWISPSSGAYVFTNRNSLKALHSTVDDLAAKFRIGEVRIVDDESLFDRAVNNVMKGLRQNPAAGA